MKCNFSKIFLVISLCIFTQGSYAQQAILSSCNDAAGVTGSVSYSFGQVFFIEKTGNGGNVMEGIQLPFEILFMAGINDEKGITLECIIYPNPAGESVKVKTEKLEGRKLICDIADLKGRVIKTMMIMDEEMIIPLQELSPSTYVITITENKRILKTFRLIKR